MLGDGATVSDRLGAAGWYQYFFLAQMLKDLVQSCTRFAKCKQNKEFQSHLQAFRSVFTQMKEAWCRFSASHFFPLRFPLSLTPTAVLG